MLRLLLPNDEPLIWQFLMLAAHESALASVRANPELARYASNWGRTGDFGMVAECDNLPIGAAWLRLWPNADKGFGWVRDEVPELAIAVLPEWQGQGIGTSLINAVLESARGAHPAISLNVRADSPAVRLYERAGFVAVPGSERRNRTGGISFNMLRELEN